jgi:hypothetical protein
MKFRRMDNLITNWKERVDYEATYLGESILGEIWRLMEESKVNKAELARRTGWSRSYATRIFAAGQNLTLRSIAAALAALEARVAVRGYSLAKSEVVGLPCYTSVVAHNIRAASAEEQPDWTKPPQISPLAANSQLGLVA